MRVKTYLVISVSVLALLVSGCANQALKSTTSQSTSTSSVSTTKKNTTNKSNDADQRATSSAASSQSSIASSNRKQQVQPASSSSQRSVQRPAKQPSQHQEQRTQEPQTLVGFVKKYGMSLAAYKMAHGMSEKEALESTPDTMKTSGELQLQFAEYGN